MAHPNPVLALGALTAALAAFVPPAQAEPNRAAPADTGGEAQTQTLLAGKPSFGGYGGPEIKGTSIMHVGSALVGGQGGVVLGHSLVIGGAGYGLVTRTDLPSELQTPDASRRLNFGYGGARLEWIILPRALVHADVGALIGGGGIAWEANNGTYKYQDGVLVADTSTRNDAFFVFEPHVAIEVNVHKIMRFAATASYRWVDGVSAAGLSNDDFRGLAFGAVTKFGVF